ncbi:UPF0158 family protein [Paenibacillus ginsengihumi]|uniref:UPF0158 family protein n=1 Tax=Paenibacillus ginsengihumi TaxID=431596 RepID=UPI0003735BB4|nr:UPF0158 family protein [Paenibacillus ginsengihumi]
MRGKKKNKRKNFKEDTTRLFDQDENFYFIAGYTDGGFPYGITWGEYEAEQSREAMMKEKAGGGHVRELKCTRQQFQESVNAYHKFVDGIDVFLNIETGDVVKLRTLDRDEEDEALSEIIEEGLNEVYFQIPHRWPGERYSDMMDFSATLEDKKLQSTLMHIMTRGGKKMARRFKHALSSDNQLLERYHDFIEERDRMRVMDWLESIGVKATME